ncbi:MAG: phosphatidate cytidylyltransferase [Thermodesulfobacteriota bacterium]|nr:phosphatidate cytidylyltransferase [Thermodesulfobacteriota bacterium]
MNSHLKRWITGIIAAPVIFAIIIYGSKMIFAALVVLLILGGVTEYNSMVFGKGFYWEKGEGLAIGILIPLAAYFGDVHLELAVITFSLIITFLLFLLRFRGDSINIASLGKVVFGFMYIPLMMSYLILIRGLEEGILWIFFILVLAFSGDISAFYVGKSIGKRKLVSDVSSGKTVEGTIGLLGGSIVGCVIFKFLFFPALSLGHVILLGFIGSILGQLGDLCESTIKRVSGVKDSGFLLPGHGGILDRLDCLLFIVPFIYYYKVFVIE